MLFSSRLNLLESRRFLIPKRATQTVDNTSSNPLTISPRYDGHSGLGPIASVIVQPMRRLRSSQWQSN